MRITRIAVFLLSCISGLAAAQQAPDGLQFNVPYVCNDGKTYVVHRCEKWPKFEACFYQHEPDSERYNTRQAVVYQMTKMCHVGAAAAASPQAAQRPADFNDSRWDCGGGTSFTVIGCQKQGGREACFVRLEQDGKTLALAPKPIEEIQSKTSACKALPQLNPAYLAEFPTPYNVVAGMLVGKPQENVTRAIGAMYQLSEIIKVFAGSRAMTADETKLLGDYSKAQAELVRQAEKAFPGQRFDPSSNPYMFKRSDPRFGFEGIPVWVTFFTRGMQEGYARAVGGSDDEYAIAVNREKQNAIKQSENQMKVQQAEANYAKDPGSVAVRHCVESGRSEVECLGEGMKTGLNQLMGGDPQEAILGKIPTGLRLTGVYSGGTGFSLNFRQDMVYVFCGGLNAEPRTYTVDRSGMQISVSIPVTTPPLVLSYKMDGTLSGGGRTIAVAGEVPAGGGGGSNGGQMQTTTTTTQRQLEPGEEREYSADQLHQNGGQFSVDQQTTSTSWSPATFQRPRTVPKTERCTVGTLPPGGESLKTATILTQVLGSKASKSANSTPGLRLNGKYEVPGGLKIEFRDDSATLECGESYNSEAYTVAPENGQFIIKFQNNTGPLSLVLQPNGTLAGSGTIEVTGRIAVQGNGGGVDYLPRKASCTLGTFQASR